MNKKMPKFKRGTKLVIEIAEVHTHWDDHDQPYNLYRVKGFRSLTLDDKGIEIILKNMVEMEDAENE